MKITEEVRPDGSARYRVQHKDVARPGNYTTRRFAARTDAAEFVRRAGIQLTDAIAWDEERKGGVSFRGQAGRSFEAYATDYVNAQTDVKEKTRKSAHADIRIIVARNPAFGAMPMGAITRVDLEAVKRSLSEHKTTRGSALKSRTKNGHLETLFAVVQHAAIVRDIPQDVSLGVKKFRVDDPKQPCPITVEEFDSILIHVAPERRALFRFILDSGMRISEALSVRWSDIAETQRGVYSVAIWPENSTRGKTEQAQRITTIPADTYKMLVPAADPVMVFPMSYDAASSEWRRAVHRAQSPLFATEFPVLLKSPTIHDLRHSHAGFLITTCHMNLAIVAERLGHKDIGITQRYYGRLVKEQAHELGVQIARGIPRGVVT